MPGIGHLGKNRAQIRASPHHFRKTLRNELHFLTGRRPPLQFMNIKQPGETSDRGFSDMPSSEPESQKIADQAEAPGAGMHGRLMSPHPIQLCQHEVGTEFGNTCNILESLARKTIRVKSVNGPLVGPKNDRRQRAIALIQ